MILSNSAALFLNNYFPAYKSLKPKIPKILLSKNFLWASSFFNKDKWPFGTRRVFGCHNVYPNFRKLIIQKEECLMSRQNFIILRFEKRKKNFCFTRRRKFLIGKYSFHSININLALKTNGFFRSSLEIIYNIVVSFSGRLNLFLILKEWDIILVLYHSIKTAFEKYFNNENS